MVREEEGVLILVVDVEKWLFVDKEHADEARIPTILVEKDINGAKWFTSMRILFQLKKWTGKRRFVPVLSCDEATYRSYEVFHVDAAPSMALLESGRALLVSNQKDEAYRAALEEADPSSDAECFQFALRYIEETTRQNVVSALHTDHFGYECVPDALYEPTDPLESGRRLFEWANQQDQE